MKEIVVINGSGGAGKDTFVQFCGEYTSIMNISSVDKVKEAAKVLAGWNGEKDEKSRKFLSDLKELGIEYNDAPFKYISNMAEEFKKIHHRQVLTDEIISSIQKGTAPWQKPWPGRRTAASSPGC